MRATRARAFLGSTVIMSRAWSILVPAAAVAAAFAAACGSSTPAPAAPAASATPPAPVATASAAPAASAAPEPSATAEPAPAPAPEASATPAPAGPWKFEPKTTSGRPMLKYENDKEIETTLGGNGGLLQIAQVGTLFVPEGALRQGVNVLFGIDAKAKGPKGGVGPIFRIGPQIGSSGAPFQIALALPAGLKTVSFAIETSTTDAKTGKSKLEWKILPATHVVADQKLAVLELETLPEGHVALTTANP
jgi:hypothetical protein